jgi:general secretion pathway protein C
MPIRLKRPQLPALRPQTLGRLAGPANLLLVVVLAYQLADLTLRLLPLSEPLVPPVSIASGGAARAPGNSGYARIADWQLFGPPEAATPTPAPVQAPETRLDLRLAGIIYRGATPLALIAEGNRPETVHRIGDRFGDAQIEQILPDRVLLARQSGLEALSLPREAIDATQSAGTTTRTGAVDAIPIARRLRQVLDGDPQALQELAHAAPYIEDGRFIGLQLRPGRDRQLLGQLGLRSGDVLTALNGVRLTDPAQGLRLMRELLQSGRVDATIRRGDSEIPMSFVLQ